MDLFTGENREFRFRKERSVFKSVSQPNIKGNTELAVADSKDEILELMDSIKEAKNEWKNAIANYEFAKDSEMVDYFTYKIKACEIMYQYFIRQAREKGIRIL